MPIYEYRCKDCGHYLNVLQKVSDDSLKECPECGQAEGLKRLISAPAFRLKGGGWYETDFKMDKDKRRNLAGGEDGGSGSNGSSKSSESSSSESASKSSESSSSGSDSSSSSGEGSKTASSGGSPNKAAV